MRSFLDRIVGGVLALILGGMTVLVFVERRAPVRPEQPRDLE